MYTLFPALTLQTYETIGEYGYDVAIDGFAHSHGWNFPKMEKRLKCDHTQVIAMFNSPYCLLSDDREWVGAGWECRL